MKRYCTECGSKLPQPNPKHCPNCGTSIGTVEGASATGEPAHPNKAPITQHQNQGPSTTGKPNQNDAPPFILVIFALVFYVSIAKWGNPFSGMMPIPTPTPAPEGILDGATFYKGPRPEPGMISYFNERGDEETTLALPGELLVHAPANAKRAEVDRALKATGVSYKVLSAIPAIGSYLIEVPQGQEAYFISTLRMMGGGYFAIPNMVLSVGAALPEVTTIGSTRIIDFTDKGIPVCGARLYDPDIIDSPSHSARVITALIDNFDRTEPTERSHGEDTAAALSANCETCPILKLNFGSDRVAWDVLERAIAASIAVAEIHCQDVVISLSVSPVTMFNAANVKDASAYADEDARNKRGGGDWEAFMKKLLNVLANSKWAKDGHVRLHNSAGNGALLCDPPAAGEAFCSGKGKLKADKGIKLTDPMGRLLKDTAYGPPLLKNVAVWCAFDHGTTKIASYSNYGDGIDCYEPYGNLMGTSFAAPIGAGKDYLAIKKRLGSSPLTPCPTPPVVPACPTAVPVTSIPTLTVTPTLTPTPTPTPIPSLTPTGCTTDAECTAYAASLCSEEDDIRLCTIRSKLFRCGTVDKACHACYRVEGISIEGTPSYDARCFTCEEGLQMDLGGDGCPKDIAASTYCERGVCVAQMGSTILTTS